MTIDHSLNDQRYMQLALNEARKAYAAGEIPVGAVVVCNGKVIGTGHNMTEMLTDITAHAEIIAITAAENYLGGKYLKDCTLYVTVEPCVMCAGAIGWSQLSRIVVGCTDEKRGYSTYTSRSPFHPKAVVTTGVCADECRQLMQDFFRERRK